MIPVPVQTGPGLVRSGFGPVHSPTHELQKNGEIDVQQIRSSDNLADLFIKALPTSTFRKLRYKIGMRQPKDVDMRGSFL